MRRALILAAAMAGLAATPAAAVHWPQQGGDGGRSGYQPVGDGSAPVGELWAAPGDVVTSVLVTGGRLADQRVIYGTASGRVHLRELATGRAVGPEDGIAVEDSLPSGVFGDGDAGASASFAESSGSGGLGLVFAVHNANNAQPFFGGLDDVEIAVVDERTGRLVHDVPVPGTVDHRVRGPAVLTPADSSGSRSLLFLASAPGGRPVLFRVVIDGGGAPGAAAAVDVPGADTRTGPALLYLSGRRPYVAVGTGDGVRTYSLARFPSEGPRSTQPTGVLGTPAVPVEAGGLTPGQPGTDASSSTGLVVSATAADGTRLHRLGLTGDELAVRASSPPLAGPAAPGIAAAQEVVGGTASAGWVVAGTSAGLHVLDARTLQPTGRSPVATGSFAATVPAAVARLAFSVRDDGAPTAVDLVSGELLGTRAFAIQSGQGGSRRGLGQPAVSRGIVVLASDRGVFAYRTRCGNAVAGSGSADTVVGGVPGDAINGYAGEDRLAGGEGDDCIDGGPGEDLLGGDPGDDLLAGGNAGDRVDGGAGDDTLLGGAGNDVLTGGSGRDRLAGGRGRDRIDGGPGSDRLNSRGGGIDKVRCGSGDDLAFVDRVDRVTADCERVVRR